MEVINEELSPATRRRLINMDKKFVEDVYDVDVRDSIAAVQDEVVIGETKRKINMDKTFENDVYDHDLNNSLGPDSLVSSPQSLKKLAINCLNNNDSGYEEVDSGRKPMNKEHINDINTKLADLQLNLDQSGLNESSNEDSRSIAALFDRHEEFYFAQWVEMVMMFMVCISIIVMVFMGSNNDETSLGGKKAAIKFYYDSLNMGRN
eukprot:TRINITY_DN37807_c0_g1_i1.p1 TRINITY_DN37807_c0_g1~~TRINITY_DN37807_c0_g1_i1.p1  ORF type:complete len:206 (-),score=59.34 TRINITY_DN37807_c0_g1_i1:129-746(-)